jgi:CRP-like cAMP-binding protein
MAAAWSCLPGLRCTHQEYHLRGDHHDVSEHAANSSNTEPTSYNPGSDVQRSSTSTALTPCCAPVNLPLTIRYLRREHWASAAVLQGLG